MLVCLSYPELEREDACALAEYRRTHDQAYCDMVDAHWTLVFPTPDVSEADMVRHLQEVTRRQREIDFVVRHAMVHDDDFGDDFYVFLVPDEGFSAISRLHNELYSGLMTRYQRVDLPYVPHIGIATNRDPHHLKRLADEWNGAGRVVAGKICEICLCEYDGKTVTELHRFRLGGS